MHHALTASRKDGLRRELLISRLVRFHWDRQHLAAIKKAYRERYREDLSEAVREGTSGEWGLFCEQLVVTRMPDEVKRFEAVEKVTDARVREAEERVREREREMDREYERQKEKERKREKEEKREREREREREKERDRERGRHHHSHRSSEGLLVVKDSKHRDPSKSRERSRSRRRE